MKSRILMLSMATLVAATSLPAQGVVVKENKPGLLKKAVIKADVATATALAKVPGGRIQSAEIEEEDGKLIYSFDIKVAGKSGIDEVAVDAKTGAATVTHETPEDEAKEAKSDKEKAGKTAKPAATAKPPAKKG